MSSGAVGSPALRQFPTQHVGAQARTVPSAGLESVGLNRVIICEMRALMSVSHPPQSQLRQLGLDAGGARRFRRSAGQRRHEQNFGRAEFDGFNGGE